MTAPGVPARSLPLAQHALRKFGPHPMHGGARLSSLSCLDGRDDLLNASNVQQLEAAGWATVRSIGSHRYVTLTEAGERALDELLERETTATSTR